MKKKKKKEKELPYDICYKYNNMLTFYLIYDLNIYIMICHMSFCNFLHHNNSSYDASTYLVKVVNNHMKTELNLNDS